MQISEIFYSIPKHFLASWLEWGSWGACSTTCGYEGRRYRSRMCDTFVLSDCDGFSRQVDPYCANQDCPGGEIEVTTTTIQNTPIQTTTTPASAEPGMYFQLLV